MKTKFISAFLIDCLLIQLVLMNAGCSSFYSTGKQDIENYCNYKDKVALKLKDDSWIMVPPNGIYQLDREKIDSIKIMQYNSNQYQVFYMNYHKHFALRLDTSLNINSEPGVDEWLIYGGKNEFSKVTRNDISDIYISKTDPIKTGILVVGIVTSIFLIVMTAHIKNFGT